MPSATAPNTKSLLLSLSSLLSVAWQLTSFAELSAYQIYNIIQAREQVFVRDQDCSYIDADGLDFEAMHLSAYQGDVESESITQQLLAYCRILMPIKFDNNDIQHHPNTSHPRIGRVLVLADYRGYGLAREVMIRATDYCHIKFPKQPIHISAQTYLIGFYQSLGFVCAGATFEEQGIEHIHMSLGSL